MSPLVLGAGRNLHDDWNPLKLRDCICWVATTHLNLANGAQVSSWPDQSGQGNDLDQATGDDQPIYTTGLTVANGHDAVRFDGVNDVLVATLSAELAAPNTTFMVFRKSDVDQGGNDSIMGNLNIGNGVSCNFFHSGASNEFRFYNGSQISGLAEDTNTHIWLGVWDGASSILHMDGNVYDANAGTRALHEIRMGSQSGIDFAEGDMYEFVAYSRNLLAAEVAVLESYASQKYGITLA